MTRLALALALLAPGVMVAAEHETPLAVAGAHPWGAWVQTTVHDEYGVMDSIPLAITKDGQPHVAFMGFVDGAYRPVYAYRDGPLWVTETMLPEHRSVYSLTTDLEDHPLVLAKGRGPQPITLFLAERSAPPGTPGTWTEEVVTTLTTTVRDGRVAVDPQGGTHLVIGQPSGLRYAYRAPGGSTWTWETVDASEDAGGEVDMALDSRGQPHLAYWCSPGSTVDFCYAVRNGPAPGQPGTWTATRLLTEAGPYPSIALDAQSHPHVSFAWFAKGLGYGYHDGTAWTLEVAAGPSNEGLHTDLALDSHGNPHIVHSPWYRGNPDTPTLEIQPRYTVKTPSLGWRTEVLDRVGSWNAADVGIALDAHDRPHVMTQRLSIREDGGPADVLEPFAGDLVYHQPLAVAAITAGGLLS